KMRGEPQPCPYYFEYERLVARKAKGIPMIECEESYTQVSVAELLDGIHYSTHDRLEGKLDAIQGILVENSDRTKVIQGIVVENHGQLKTILDYEIENKQLSEQLLRESIRSWNFQLSSLFNDLPSLFLFMPSDRNRFDPRNIFNKELVLYLLCQHP